MVSLETGPFRCSKLLARGGNWFCLGPQVIGGSTGRDFHDWFNPLILISLYYVDKRESHPLDPNFQFINLWLRRATKELLDLSQKWKTCRIVKSFSIFALIMVLSHSALLHERLFYHKNLSNRLFGPIWPNSGNFYEPAVVFFRSYSLSRAQAARAIR